MAAKSLYRVRNWSEYNKALVRRGDLTVWVEEDSLKSWKALPTGHSGQPFLYSETAIECCLTLRSIFHLPLRATQGFLFSLFKLMEVELPVPNYSTLSRRAEGLDVDLEAFPSQGGVHLVIDSTGFKVYGEGEWKVRTHGASKRRTWKKMHIAISAKTFEVLSVETTSKDVHDTKVTSRLIPKDRKIEAVYADKAYDNKVSLDPIANAGARAIIPPRSGAALTKPAKLTPGLKLRNKNVSKIWKVGEEAWKVETHYHTRSLVETEIYRFKQIFGERLRSRKDENQKTEMRLWSRALNRITHLGMPKSRRITW